MFSGSFGSFGSAVDERTSNNLHVYVTLSPTFKCLLTRLARQWMAKEPNKPHCLVDD